MFATRVEPTERIISLSSLAACRVGIKKRIRREKNRFAHSNDGEYRAKRLDNIRRLEIIAKSIQELEMQL